LFEKVYKKVPRVFKNRHFKNVQNRKVKQSFEKVVLKRRIWWRCS